MSSSSSTTASDDAHPRASRRGRACAASPTAAAQPERGAQHRRARGARGADRLRRRRRARPARAGWRRWPRAPPAHPEAEAFGGPIRARFEGRPPRGCGREDPPITTLDLGARGPRGRLRVGRELRRAAQARRADRARSTSASCGPTATRRSGSSGCARRAGGSCTWPAPGSTTAAPPRTRGCGRWPAPPTRAAAARGQRPPARARSPALGARAARAGRLRLAHAATRLPAGHVMGAHSAGRVVETLRPTAREDPGTSHGLPVRRRGRRDPSLAARQAGARRAGLRRASTAPRWPRAATDAPGRRPAPPRRVLVLGVYRPGSLLAQALGRCARERHDVRFALGAVGEPGPAARRAHGRRAARRRQVREPQPRAGGAGGELATSRLAARRGRRPAPARRASSTASSRSASASGSTSPSPPRPSAATPPGGHAAAAAVAGARDALRRDRAADRLRRRAAASCCRSPSCASAGGSTCTGRPLAARARLAPRGGRRHSGAPRVGARRLRPTPERRGERRGRPLPRRPALPAGRARRRRAGRAPAGGR